MTDPRRSLVGALSGVLLLGALAAGVGATAVSAQTTTAPDCPAISYDGDGSESNPYEVVTVDQLQCVGNSSTPTSLQDTFRQVSDIDASGTDGWNGGSGFAPVGDNSTQFTGTFDGSGFTITGLTIDRSRPAADGTGLFGVTGSSALIENVSLENASVSTSNTRVGALVGENNGVVESSNATVTVSGGSRVGGLVGRNAGTVNSSVAASSVDGLGIDVGGLVGNSTGTVNSSYATGTVSGINDVGGLVGGNTGTVRDSNAAGTVSGTDFASEQIGGLVGLNNGGTVTSSSATGNVSGDAEVGGLVGRNAGQGTVRESNATGNVSGDAEVGGLVGRNAGTVESSNATGTVSVPSSSGSQVGGLVGRNDGGTVTESYATATVSGSANSAGGLVGGNSGTVSESYATGTVSGSAGIGGLVGGNSGTVSKSYATGTVSGSSTIGGLVGGNSGTVTDSYWDLNTTGQSGSDGGTGLTTDQLKANTSLAGFEFTNTWDVLTTAADGAVSYPFLRNSTQTPAPGLERLYAGGDGSASNPYEIADWYHLDNTRLNLGANFTLVAELNESTAGYDSVASASANGGAGFDPIGGLQAADRFTGTFDGNNHSIDGLTIDRPNEDRVGLFGYVWNGGTVRNLTLTNATVTGDNRVGGVAGFVEGGTVRQSSVEGNVTGTSSVGGIAGVVFDIEGSITQDPVRSVISESSATGTVTGQNGRAGGLLGLSKSTLEQSYATAQVTAGSDTPTGGLVAVNGNEGIVRDSYAAGPVAGAVTGGVTGQTSGTVKDVYWDLNATSQENATALGSAGNAMGVTTAELTGSDAGRNTNLSFGTTWRPVLGEYPALLAEVPGPPPLVGEQPPQDLDGDGRYEDVNGDGTVNVLDVQALFNSLDDSLLQRDAVLFDFQGNDPTEVGVLDVQSLYDREATS